MIESRIDGYKLELREDGYWFCVKPDREGLPMLRRLIMTEKGRTPYTITLKRFRSKRSLDANAYCWVLLDKLAEATGISKTEIYRSLIKEIGGNCEIMPIRKDAVERWKAIWSGRGLGWICEELGESKLNGYVNVCSYYGSSVYDVRQMSALIDLVVQECKAQDIETATDADLALLKEGWGEKANQRP